MEALRGHIFFRKTMLLLQEAYLLFIVESILSTDNSRNQFNDSSGAIKADHKQNVCYYLTEKLVWCRFYFNVLRDRDRM